MGVNMFTGIKVCAHIHLPYSIQWSVQHSRCCEAMVMKCTAVCLVALSLLGSLCDAQWPHKPQKPGREETKLPPQQVKQEFEKELTWRYPVPPTPAPVPVRPFQLRFPVAAASVAVECLETTALVEVKRDLFGTGQFINPTDLTLGLCNAVGQDQAAQVLIFQTALFECGSVLTVSTIL